VGTAVAVAESAKEVGLPFFLVQCDRGALRNALEKAVQISQIRRRNIKFIEEMERQIIEQAMELVGGSKGELARVLGLSRTTLWKKLKKFGKTS